MTLRERLHWIFRIALMLFILASVAFLSALTAMRFAIQGREVTMPDVVGRKAIEAQQLLQERGVALRVEDRIYSSQPVDTVVRQSPPPGMRVKIGQYVHVVLSLGPQKVSIPQLGEKRLRAARIELLRGGMQLGEISSVHVPGWAEDTVIEQEPAPGTRDITSSHVDLLVSLGPRSAAYLMPDLTGLSLGEGQARLNAAGLKALKITLTPSPGAARGTIIGQTPPRGARVEAGEAIELQVAE